MSDIWAVIPVKEFDGAKHRLSGLLSPPQRRLLAETMLTDMLDAVAGSRLLAGVMIVTLDPHATALGNKIGARIVTEGARDGHTGSVNAGRRLLAGEGRGGMITMPGDIPATRAGEIDAVLSAHLAAPSFTISPAHDDLGSNAVVCSPPESVPLRFGDNSYFPHLDAARRAGHRADGDPSARNRDGYRPSGRSGAFPAPAAISRHADPHAARRTWRARAAGRAGDRWRRASSPLKLSSWPPCPAPARWTRTYR